MHDGFSIDLIVRPMLSRWADRPPAGRGSRRLRR